MALNYRVMKSTLGHGVAVHTDRLLTEDSASYLANRLNKKNKSKKVLGYFYQSYEECRELYK